MAILPPELWLMVFKYLRAMYRKDIVCRLEQYLNFERRITHIETRVSEYTYATLTDHLAYEICHGTLVAILAVNVSSSGFNALTVILILLILSSCSTCITNVFKIYTLKQELQK